MRTISVRYCLNYHHFPFQTFVSFFGTLADNANKLFRISVFLFPSFKFLNIISKRSSEIFPKHYPHKFL